MFENHIPSYPNDIQWGVEPPIDIPIQPEIDDAAFAQQGFWFDAVQADHMGVFHIPVHEPLQP
ncbi:hypothetical protein [Acidovorax avenae]|uniref:hypothetical protein n=1 Tax=Paracidovorax avenae TaxID=80867 RepID=UPI001864AB82